MKLMRWFWKNGQEIFDKIQGVDFQKEFADIPLVEDFIMKVLYIISAGGFGREVASFVGWNIKGFIDDNKSLW